MKDRAVSIVYPSLSQFAITIKAGSADKPGGRNFLFSGPSNIACPSKATCEHYECPAGSKLVENAPFVACEGSSCSGVDTTVCCEAEIDLCADECQLSFDHATLASNNLGRQGPDTGNQSMTFKNVFPKSADAIDLEITSTSRYAAHRPAMNGLHPVQEPHFARINVKSGTPVDLKLKLSSKPTHPFYLTFWDVDSNGGDVAVEMLRIKGFSKYVIASHTTVQTQEVDGGLMEFIAAQRGTGKDNPRDPRAATQDQLSKAVSFLMPATDDIRLTLEVHGGRKGRNFFFSGSSGLVCTPSRRLFTLV
jgi:hypothetical protein